MNQGTEGEYHYPAHGNINHRRKPFRTGYPEGFYEHPYQGNTPNQSQKGVAQFSSKNNQADRSIGACDQHKNHHMVYPFKNLQFFSAQIHAVVGGACSV